MKQLLTRRQRAIYEFIVDHVRGGGIPPSLTEIAQAFDLASASGVADHLRAIERKGYIRRRPGISRGIELIGRRRRPATPDPAVRVPVVGTVPARRRLSAQRGARRHLFFDGRVAADGAIAVRVSRGLRRHGILRGDYVIVSTTAMPEPGELALAHLGRLTALVERLPGDTRVRRLDTEDELRHGFELLGRVVAVLRSIDGTTRKAI